MQREPVLSGSWYPDKMNQISKILNEWTEDIESEENHFAAVVPHAGWFYSGRIAASVLKKIGRKDIFFIAGGHLPAGASVVAAPEDEIITPAGIIRNRVDIIDNLRSTFQIENDLRPDNTVEIVLPIIKYLYPESDIVWLRLPPDSKALLAADAVCNLNLKNESAAFIGSTDLTHYGDDYGYIPVGNGPEGLKWVKEKNDSEIIELLLNQRYEKALMHGNKNRSACSIGAAVAAARYAERNGILKGVLDSYSTSYDTAPAESFVGYAGLMY